MSAHNQKDIFAQKLFQELQAARISVTLEGSQLRVRAPSGTLTDALKTRLRDHRDALVDYLGTAGISQADTSRTADAAGPRENPHPLSFAQQRLWFLERVNAGSNAYLIGGAVRVSGALDVDLLFEAFRTLARRHEALRTRFGERAGEPYAEVLDDMPPGQEIIDVLEVPEQERASRARGLIADKMSKQLDLQTGPLFAVTVYRFAPDDHVVLTRIHHIVSDGWSMAVISRELLEIYGALRDARPVDLPPVEAHCADHTQYERDHAASGKWRDDIAYWVEELAGVPALTELPLDRPHPSRPSYKGTRFSVPLDEELCAGLRKVAAQSGATLFMVMLAGLQALLHRHSGQEDVLVGTPVANRMERRFTNTVGCLINNVVLRGELGQDPTFTEFLAQAKAKVLSAHDHCETPFDKIVEELKPERTTNHAPVFQVLFNLMSFPEYHYSLPGTTSVDIPVDIGATRFDLAVDIVEHAGRMNVFYEYATDLFDRATIMSLHQRYETLLRSIVAEPGCRISEIDIVSEADRVRLSELAAARPADYDRSTTIDRLIDEVAARHPDKPAVIAAGAALDYRSLVERANGLAARLAETGIGIGDLVAVALDPGADLVVALLAVWKAGAAYVPLDPHHPADRLAMILEDGAPALVITAEDIAPKLPDTGTPRLLIDAQADTRLEQGPERSVQADDLAYVIYTSGSTGRPKGVEVDHRNLASFLAAMQLEPGLAAEDKVLSVTTPSFDIAGLEIWLPLITGATTVLADRTERIDGAALARLLSAKQITLMQATPATWRLLLESGWSGMLRLKALCGGEAMPRVLAEALIPKVMSLWNMYGPTETTIWSTLQRVETAEDAASIGRPIQNTRIAVMDKLGRPLPPGIVGELCIAGDGVARGYRNRPDLTAERFALLDFPGTGPVRAYRTGDLVRQRSDGGIVYVGRNDHQVKVRGFRIELGEVEAQLAAVPGVADCVVSVHVPEGGQAALAAYVVRAGTGAFSPEKARSQLRTVLPEYMVPSWFVVLDKLPLTPNLKIDRKALPKPELSTASADTHVADSMVMSETERRIAALWREVLGIRSVGLDQSFFDVGGHSMLLVKLHEKLSATFGNRFPLIELFRRTTVASQAEGYDGGGEAAEAAQVMRARQRAEQYGNV